MIRRSVPATRSSTAGHVAGDSSPDASRTSGASSRSGWWCRSPDARPFEHVYPAETGLSGSPPTSSTRSPSTVTVRPQKAGQSRQNVVRRVAVTPAMVLAGASVAVVDGRHVECGVALEEPDRDEVEPAVLDRHHGPVLGPRQVGHAEGVPHHDVGPRNGPV